jgi:hypothetical protein
MINGQRVTGNPNRRAIRQVTRKTGTVETVVPACPSDYTEAN